MYETRTWSIQKFAKVRTLEQAIGVHRPPSSAAILGPPLEFGSRLDCIESSIYSTALALYPIAKHSNILFAETHWKPWLIPRRNSQSR